MTTVNVTLVKVLPLLSVFAAAGVTWAAPVSDERAAVVTRAAVSASPEMPTTMPPYSLPWQLRPVTADSLVRFDTAAAVFNDAQGNLDIAVPTIFVASYQLARHWAPTIRLGVVGNNAPGAAFDGTSFANPSLGLTYARALGSYHLALFAAMTIPLGTGGGDAPNLQAAEANAAAFAARPAEAAMFAANYLAQTTGLDLAYVGHGLTVQAEMTFVQYLRVRGGDSSGAADAFRTQAALGLHVGYFIGSHFSFAADVHHRRWLSHPTAPHASAGPRITFSGAGLDTTTIAVGPRAHFRWGNSAWVRPGLSFVRGLDARGLDAPLLTAQATAVLLDIPVTF